MNKHSITDLIGKTLVSAINVGDEELHLKTNQGETFRFYHCQDCCESVYIESITGDLEDLVGSPILKAEESISDKDPSDFVTNDTWRESFTWTFYKFATRKGYVDVRWLGESNGYYSESVDLEVIKNETV